MERRRPRIRQWFDYNPFHASTLGKTEMTRILSVLAGLFGMPGLGACTTPRRGGGGGPALGVGRKVDIEGSGQSARVLPQSGSIRG